MKQSPSISGPESVAFETGSTRFRPDVEGLRGVAVILVMLYHARTPGFGGGYVGVDVFFVISGFLITGVILRELERTGTVDLPRFYGRRVRRLLPASAVVLATVSLLTFLVLPVIRWSIVSKDVVWSSLYVVNWRFAAEAIDYLAIDNAPSPLQHYWSLAVEEQFYLIWPLTLFALGSFAIGRKLLLRRVLVVGLVAIGLPSLLWSLYLTGEQPGRAFFVSTTRVWELAIGGALALGAPWLARLPKRYGAPLSILGLGGLLIATVTFGETTLFPGYAALLPVGATVAILAAGIPRSMPMIPSLLGKRPLVAVGAMSYSLYLWHWPLIVFADAAWGPLRRSEALIVVFASTVPAYLSYRFVEQRWRYSDRFVEPRTRGLRYGLGLSVFGVLTGVALYVAIPVSASGLGEIRPHPLQARADIPDVYANGCHQDGFSAAVMRCEYGPEDAQVKVFLVGDSHAAQWAPTLESIALSNSWSLTTVTKSGCQLADVSISTDGTNRPSTSCVDWNTRVLSMLIESSPDAVLVTGIFWPTLVGPAGVLDDDETQRALVGGLGRTWSTLRDAGIRVVPIRDVPYPRTDVAECVSASFPDFEACAFDRVEAMIGNTPAVEAAQRLGIDIIDLTDEICFSIVCPAVHDGTLRWRDTNHLTATYATILADSFETKMYEVLPDLFGSAKRRTGLVNDG